MQKLLDSFYERECDLGGRTPPTCVTVIQFNKLNNVHQQIMVTCCRASALISILLDGHCQKGWNHGAAALLQRSGSVASTHTRWCRKQISAAAEPAERRVEPGWRLIGADRRDITHTVPRDTSSRRGELMRRPGGLWDAGKAFV